MADKLEQIKKKHRETLAKLKKVQQGSRDPEMLNIIREIIKEEDNDAKQDYEINRENFIDKAARPRGNEDLSQRI
ncbi:MAG: hypothetical protein OXB88_02765 [Bacteriovoracales bacterium]|nr:hypothetical protein [Bacteriovoracales bacterium]